MIEPSLTAFIGFPFALVFTCIYVHGIHCLNYEVHELDGYDHEFWKTSGYSLKCVLQLVASTSHAKVPSKALDWALANVLEGLDFLSHYRAANRIKPAASSFKSTYVSKVPLTSSGTRQF